MSTMLRDNLIPTEDEQKLIDEVAKAKEDWKKACRAYSDAMAQAYEKMHYKKLARGTGQSEGAIRMQYHRAKSGRTAVPRID